MEALRDHRLLGDTGNSIWLCFLELTLIGFGLMLEVPMRFSFEAVFGD